MRFTFFCLLFLLSLVEGARGADFSNWRQDTPHGNEIAYDDWGTGSSILVHCRRSVDRVGVAGLRRWYFYGEAVVGELDDAAEHRYFAFDESTCETTYFSDRTAFDRYIERSDLRPRLWTRWHDSHHGVIYSSVRCFACRPVQGLLLWFILGALPLRLAAALAIGSGAIGAVWAVTRIVRSRFDLRRARTGIAILLIAGLAVRLILDVYPHSL